jgi:CelD/BcsL family acetyltransferase involved in cellulose biosynthesis/GNAT superfamily N-acetyltransferase
MAGGSGALDHQNSRQRWLFCDVEFLYDVMTSQPVASCQAATLLVYSDSEALQIIASPEFQSQWRALVHNCPWATALQTPEFACTWYQCYEEVYRPLILVRYAVSGEMDGLMALATDRASGKLTFAGAHQAEYNVWLALPGEQTFIVEALGRLQRLGFSSLTFTYLPPGTPLEWLQAGWMHRSTIRTVPKPLLTVDNADPVRDSLSKKKNRRRLEKLQADGPLSFLELHTPDELEAYYDELMDFYDFRTGAFYGRCPFREDPRKRAFYRALMAQGRLLHVGVMKVGEKLVGAHIGIRNKNEVMMVLVGHSPFLAAYSPGKLHILQLGLLLHEQGFSSLDLTPGGDAYKEDRADRYDEAYVLSIFLDGKAWTRHRVTSRLRSIAKRMVSILHLDKEKLARWQSAGNHPIRSLRSLLRSIKNRIWSSTEMRFYRAETNVVDTLYDAGVRRNNLQHLLCYEPAGRGCRSKQEFLRDAIARIESGVHAYSVVRGDVLVNYAWLTSVIGKSFVTEVEHAYEFPPHSVLLQQIYTHPSYRGQGLCSRTLKQIVNDEASIGSAEFVYAAVPAGNRAGWRALEQAGFKYQDSIIREVRFGAAKVRVATNSV